MPCGARGDGARAREEAEVIAAAEAAAVARATMEKIRTEAPSITTTDGPKRRTMPRLKKGTMQEDFAANSEEKEEEDTSEWPQAGGPITLPRHPAQRAFSRCVQLDG